MGTKHVVPPALIGSMSLLYLRHSVRAYKPNAVSEEQIRLMLDAAVHAPTAMHREPWQFVVIQNREMLKDISDEAKALLVRQSAESGRFLKAKGAPGDGIGSLLADPEFNIFYDAGTLIVICAEPKDDFTPADCWLAAQNLMLAAAAEGLGSCCIGFATGALNLPSIKEQLRIPAASRAYAAIVVGVERGDSAPVPRNSPLILSWMH